MSDSSKLCLEIVFFLRDRVSEKEIISRIVNKYGLTTDQVRTLISQAKIMMMHGD